MQCQLRWHYLRRDRSACHCARAPQLCINIKQLGRPAACLCVLQRCKRGRDEPPQELTRRQTPMGPVLGENTGVKIQKHRGTHIVGCQVWVQVVDALNGILTLVSGVQMQQSTQYISIQHIAYSIARKKNVYVNNSTFVGSFYHMTVAMARKCKALFGI